jgi:uncharacterized damage-inducible protein DinB
MEDEQKRRYLLSQLATERAALLVKLLDLDEAMLIDEPVFDEWTVKDILAHIAAWDRCEERTFRAMVAGDPPDFSAVQDFAVANAAFVTEWRERSLDEVIAELMAARSDWVTWLECLPDKEFFRPRSYFGDEWTFSEIPLRVQWEHDAEHGGQIANWREVKALKTGIGPRSVVVAAMEAARQELLAAAAMVPIGERESRQVCGEWTVKDVLGHVADWEWYAVKGLREMARGPEECRIPDPEPVEGVDAWNTTHVEARSGQSWEFVREDLQTARQELLKTFLGIRQADITISYPHVWGGRWTPYRWVIAFLEHDLEHAQDLTRR